MASRRALIALSVVALMMVALVLLDPSRGDDSVVRSRSVVPEFSRGVVSISWERPGQASVTIERRGQEFVLTAPLAAVANPSAVLEVLDTIELLSYLSRSTASRPELARPHARVIIRLRSGPPVELRLGGRVASGAGAWVGRDGSAYLIDGYAARALDRRLGDLREREVFGIAAGAITGMEIQHKGRSLVLSNTPMQVHLDGGGSVRVRRDVARKLVRVLERMTILRFGDSTSRPEPTGSRVRVVGGPSPVELEVVGSCDEPARTLVQTPVGLGCVETRSLEFVWGLLSRGESLYERSLLPPPRVLRSLVVRVGTSRIELRNHPSGWRQVGKEAVQADAIRAWLVALADLAQGAFLPVAAQSKRGSIHARIDATDRTGIVTKLVIYALGGRLFAHRNDEPTWIALRPTATRFGFAIVPTGRSMK